MPKIVRTGGVNVSDDVVKIRDVAPSKHPSKSKSRPADDDAPVFIADESFGIDQDGAEEGQPPGAQGEDGLETQDFEDDAFGGGGRGAARSAIEEEIIQSAVSEAGRILERAVREGEEKREALLAGVQGEAEAIRQSAAEEGRREGYDTVVGDVKQAASELEGAVARFEGERAGYEAEYEEQLKWMALEIAGKVLNEKVAEDDAVLAGMVEKAVDSVRSEPWIHIEVAQEMTRLIDRLGTLYEGQANIEVSAAPLPDGTVQLETPSGVVDASLSTQLANLKAYFGQAQN